MQTVPSSSEKEDKEMLNRKSVAYGTYTPCTYYVRTRVFGQARTKTSCNADTAKVAAMQYRLAIIIARSSKNASVIYMTKEIPIFELHKQTESLLLSALFLCTI